MGMTIVLGLLRWRMVLGVQGLNLSLLRTAEISLVAHFFNSFLLGSTGGDLLKAYYAARETHHKKTEAVMTVLVDRLVGLFAMLLFAVLMMLPNLALLARHGRLAALSWLVVCMMAGCGGLVVLAFWGGVTRRCPAPGSGCGACPGVNFWRGRWTPAGSSAGTLFPDSNACVFHDSQRLLRSPEFWFGARAAPGRSPLALFVIVPIIVCISALPITPSGLGLRENLYVLMLAVPEINADPTRALSLSLLAYAGSLVWSMIGGVVYLSRRDRDHLTEIAATAPIPEVGGK